MLDEALVWAAKSGRTEVLEVLREQGARVDADPYRGTALTWAAVNGHVDTVRRLVDLGADPTIRDALHGGDAAGWASFGGHEVLADRLRSGR